MRRREELLEKVTDHALAHGLIGLSLRPLAAAADTSDRMLLYHFGTRDDLVTAIIRAANDRATAAVGALDPAARVSEGVVRLWAAYQCEPLRACEQLYVQAAASGLLGQEPYRSGVREANARWTAALADYLLRCGARPERVERATRLVDAALLGFHVDVATEAAQGLARGVDDLAGAVQDLAG